MKSKVKIIGFDADDTLWVNEPLFQHAEHEYYKLFKDIMTEKELFDILFRNVINNLGKYGYGAKGLMLSMIQTALEIYKDEITQFHIQYIMNLGNTLLEQPRHLIDGVEDTLKKLHGKYKLILITKGDLLEQEKKIEKSGLTQYFHHTEILTEKNEHNYNVLFNNLNIQSDEFLMIGNSLKSDINPILKLGCYGIYIPYYVTWEHEQMNVADVANEKFMQIDTITQLPNILLDENYN